MAEGESFSSDFAFSLADELQDAAIQLRTLGRSLDAAAEILERDGDPGLHAPDLRDLSAALRVASSPMSVKSGSWHGYAVARQQSGK